MKKVKIIPAGPAEAPVVLDLVARLLEELGEEGEETGALDARKLTAAWNTHQENHCAFLALDGNGQAVGVATLSTAFALYANGCYGIINEMYVTPELRSGGVGALLIEAVKAHGLEHGWRRIDVTAPESERWVRTRTFYESQGFHFTGPKLKLLLS